MCYSVDKVTWLGAVRGSEPPYETACPEGGPVQARHSALAAALHQHTLTSGIQSLVT